ncbi:MAG: hypothetical protein U0931_12820 [Vulcanimicrobiota bacterium]
MKVRRGFVLIFSLLLLLLLALGGMILLGQRAAQYRASVLASKTAVARALAQAGLEDARVKLEKDLNFPPPGDQNQVVFSYDEPVTDLDGKLVGYYFVTVDSRHRTPLQPPAPNEPSIVVVTAMGRAGQDPKEPEAVYALSMEVEVDDYFDDTVEQQMIITDWREVTDFSPE